MAPDDLREVTIGILAMQGAFIEHEKALQRLRSPRKIDVLQVRTREELARCDALIIPGGESTTIALLARLEGILDPLRDFRSHKPVWGTCAGAILLSERVENTKRGGQEVLGGVSATIARNGWGSQVESFEANLEVEGLRDPQEPFIGVFIRAPVLLELHPSHDDPPVQVVARLPPGLLPPSLASDNPDDAKAIVALRQGLHLLTTFHPELTPDDRFHEYFVRECVLPTIAAKA
ncbi:PdxT/SNO family [Schizophyllum amplum]|uniref:glutaminase n=1 Tax=Schizophyllum amplum TaxID=97359 RepID=A0A550CVA2_9AGAR|nr:PdxT/SNO family [Auriculariopsis ampla]